MKCVNCEAEAVTTAVQIPVCAECHRAYAEEADAALILADLPDRSVFRRLIDNARAAADPLAMRSLYWGGY